MNKEIIPNRQGIYIIVMFFIGSFVIVGTNITAKQDVWISIILTLAVSIPMLYIYSKLLTTYPGKNLFDVFIEVYGNIIGRIISLLFAWYALHLGSLIIRNYSEYINIASFPETPQIVTVFFVGLLCIWMAKAGIEVLGRWASFTAPLIIFILAIVISLSLTNADYSNLKPIMYDGMGPVLSTSFAFLFFPFLELIIFTMLFNNLQDNKKTFKVFLISILVGSLLLMAVLLRNIIVLGPNTINDILFPAILAVEVIDVGFFVERIEIVVTVVFIFGAFVRISACLLATSIGVSKILGIDNYRYLVAPLGFTMMCLSTIVYSSAMDMFNWAGKYYSYYAIPFQLVIPIITLITAKIKIKIQSKKQKTNIKTSDTPQSELE